MESSNGVADANDDFVCASQSSSFSQLSKECMPEVAQCFINLKT